MTAAAAIATTVQGVAPLAYPANVLDSAPPPLPTCPDFRLHDTGEFRNYMDNFSALYDTNPVRALQMYDHALSTNRGRHITTEQILNCTSTNVLGVGGVATNATNYGTFMSPPVVSSHYATVTTAIQSRPTYSSTYPTIISALGTNSSASAMVVSTSDTDSAQNAHSVSNVRTVDPDKNYNTYDSTMSASNMNVVVLNTSTTSFDETIGQTRKKRGRGRGRGGSSSARSVQGDVPNQRGRQSTKRKLHDDKRGKRGKIPKADPRYVCPTLNMVSDCANNRNASYHVIHPAPFVSLQNTGTTDVMNCDNLVPPLTTNTSEGPITNMPAMTTTMTTLPLNTFMPPVTNAFGPGMPHVRTNTQFFSKWNQVDNFCIEKYLMDLCKPLTVDTTLAINFSKKYDLTLNRMQNHAAENAAQNPCSILQIARPIPTAVVT